MQKIFASKAQIGIYLGLQHNVGNLHGLGSKMTPVGKGVYFSYFANSCSAGVCTYQKNLAECIVQ